MTQTFTIDIEGEDGTDIPVTVTRKRVKNFNLRITSTGTVRASAPLTASRERIEDFIVRNRPWILKRLAQRTKRAAQRPVAEPLSPTATVPIWGRAVSVAGALAHNFETPVARLPQATFATFLGAKPAPATTRSDAAPDLVGCPPEELARRIEALYRSEVADTAPELIHAYEVKMGVSVTRLTVRSMKTRWGSCTPKTGAIRLALELAAYPPECLDMVVAHELTHLLEPSHNARFHALLDTYCPANRAVAARLKLPPLDGAGKP